MKYRDQVENELPRNYCGGGGLQILTLEGRQYSRVFFSNITCSVTAKVKRPEAFSVS